jgi:hypothetical protein
LRRQANWSYNLAVIFCNIQLVADSPKKYKKSAVFSTFYYDWY